MMWFIISYFLILRTISNFGIMIDSIITIILILTPIIHITRISVVITIVFSYYYFYYNTKENHWAIWALLSVYVLAASLSIFVYGCVHSNACVDVNITSTMIVPFLILRLILLPPLYLVWMMLLLLLLLLSLTVSYVLFNSILTSLLFHYYQCHRQILSKLSLLEWSPLMLCLWNVTAVQRNSVICITVF